MTGNRMSYDEFLDWAVHALCNAVITGGFAELRKCFKYEVMRTLFVLHKNWEWNK